MKCLAALGVLLLVGVTIASPITRDEADKFSPKINENVKIDEPRHRWTLIPDGSGKMHLIDLNPYEAEAIEPSFNAQNDVFFLLFTRRNPTSGQRLTTNNANAIRNTNWNNGVPTRFIIHGWNNDGRSPVNTQITQGYLARGDFNVVVVDWGVGANSISYAFSRNQINAVSAVVADFIRFLVANAFTNHVNLSVIGHSLGGHIAGLTGKRFTSPRLNTVIGLDPAGPLFHMNSPNERIANNDAVYVEVMHTNGWTLGFAEPLAQADFYPNFGRSQPGCGVDVTGACAHGRATSFFAESLQANNRFVANRCANFNEVNNGRCTVQSGGHRMGGEPANRGLSGIFHLTTNANSPFARG